MDIQFLCPRSFQCGKLFLSLNHLIYFFNFFPRPLVAPTYQTDRYSWSVSSNSFIFLNTAVMSPLYHNFSKNGSSHFSSFSLYIESIRLMTTTCNVKVYSDSLTSFFTFLCVGMLFSFKLKRKPCPFQHVLQGCCFSGKRFYWISCFDYHPNKHFPGIYFYL